MDRTWRFRRDVAWNAIGPGELPKQPQHPVSAALDIRKSLRIGAFEIAMRDQPRTAVAGPDNIDHVQIALFDQTVEMDIDEVEPGGSAPMPKQTRFDVFELERGVEQRIVLKINLPDREVIGGAPITSRSGRFIFRTIRCSKPLSSSNTSNRVCLGIGALPPGSTSSMSISTV